MNDYNEIIYQSLKKQDPYKNITKKDILDGSQFNQKQFESICLELYRTFMQKYLPEDKIQIRLLNIDTMNGLAKLIGDTYYSLIHWGTITNIYKYSLYLTENPSFFPEIYKDKNWKKCDLNDISESDKQKESYYQKVYACGTNDSYRRDLAFLISFFAWFSTISHEAGHILDGHLVYRNNHFHESSLAAFQKNPDNDLCLKALEKDADEFSANRMIEYAFIPENVFKNEYSHIVKNDKILIQLIATGITLKFLLYGITNNTTCKTYLPNAYRIINMLDAAYFNLINNFNCSLSKKEYEVIIVDSIQTVISVFNDTLTPPINTDIFKQQLFLGLKENEKLKPVWNELYPELNKYKNKHVNLAPLFE